MKKIVFLILSLMLAKIGFATSGTERALWASVNSNGDGNPSGPVHVYNDIILVNWRMLPTDDAATAFDLYRTEAGKAEVKLNSAPISAVTCWQDKEANRSVEITYRLTYAGQSETLDTHVLPVEQNKKGLPYTTLPLASTESISGYPFWANDGCPGDLDGDGQYEFVLKRNIRTDVDSTAITNDNLSMHHNSLIEAYELDGTLMWRVLCGPNITVPNMAVADFDGDGKDEIAFRTAEGTVFGDGAEIGDTNGDGKIDYRIPGQNYLGDRPEFFSVVEGTTGKELARANYIPWESSEAWGDSYNKRASSFRVAVAHVTGEYPSIIIARGVYARSVLEAWDFRDGKLTRRWNFDTNKGYGSYAGQGYHSLSVGDVDNDGFDEIVYGSCTIDHNGKGLNCCGLGHGDALHLGKFDPNHDGLLIWSCHETGSTGASLRDAKTGIPIWKHYDAGDVGRAMIADIDPRYEGCEMWCWGSTVFNLKGEDLGYNASSCNMGVWFAGDSTRQLLNGGRVDLMRPGKGVTYRVLHAQSYGVDAINGTKENPTWYGDIFGDWREEIIYPDPSYTKELKIFSTWYPTEAKQPWLMTDHVYEMSAKNQNVGYNQPTHLGYYFGTHGNSSDVEEKAIDSKTLWTFDKYTPGDTISFNEHTEMNGLYMLGNGSNPMIAEKAATTLYFGDDTVKVNIALKSKTGRDLSNKTETVAKMTAGTISIDCCCGVNVNMEGKLYLAFKTATKRMVQVYFNGEQVYYEAGTNEMQIVELDNTEPGTYIFLCSGAYTLYGGLFVPKAELPDDDDPEGMEAEYLSPASLLTVEDGTIILGKEQYVQIFNTMGVLEYEGVTSRVTNLSKGIYFVKTNEYIQKVVIN